MRFISIFSFLMLIVNVIYSQEEEGQSQIKVKYNPFKTPVEDHDDIWEVKFGSGPILEDKNSVQSNKFPFNFSIQYFYEINLNAQKILAIALGLGYDFQQLKLNGVFIDSPEDNFISKDQFLDLSNPRLNINTINIPIEFRVKLKNELKFYFGYNFSFPVSSNLKYKLEGDERKDKNIAPLNSFDHGPSIRIGFKDFFLFGRYSLIPTFKSIDSNLLTFGISFGG